MTRATIAGSFSPRRNSLNALRLALAVLVVLSHSRTIGSFGSEDIAAKTSLGTLAVYGFFGLSGFLVAGSATRNSVGRYLFQRLLRIVPAFWACLVVTAFVFGTLTWYHANPALARHCGLACYLRQPQGPLGYVFNNLWLQVTQSTIAHTLPLGFFRPVWNGSLWTLSFEFLCYLVLAVLSLVGLLRHRVGVLVLTVAVWVTEIVVTAVPGWNQHFSPGHHWVLMKMLTFVPIFLSGSLLYLYRQRVPDSGLLAWGCTLAFLAGLVVPLGHRIPTFSLTSVDLTAVFLAYPLLWLGLHLPLQRVGARNDYSYGVYIYAYPVQQLLVVAGLSRLGYWPYTLLALVAVLPLAAASWWGLERHALRLKALGQGVRTRAAHASRASEGAPGHPASLPALPPAPAAAPSGRGVR